MESNYTQPHVLRDSQGRAVMKISKPPSCSKDIPPNKLLFVHGSSWQEPFVVPEIIDFTVNGLEVFL